MNRPSKKREWLLLCILLPAFLNTTNLYAQTGVDKTPVSVTMNDYRVFTGRMNLPKVTDKKVDLEVQPGRIISLDADDIQCIHLTSVPGRDADNPVQLHYCQSKEYRTTRDAEPQMGSQKKWMMQVLNHGILALFIVVQEYDRFNPDNLHQQAIREAIPANTWIYLKKEQEVVPTRISLSHASGYGSNQHFRAVGARYFEDCEHVSQRISQGDITNENIEEALRLYYEYN